MKCVKCGAEMKEGCLYCSVCGHEQQILPDYSVLEDDYLRTILKEENQKKSKTEKQREPDPPVETKKKKKKNNMIPIIIVCCILAAAIIAGIAIKVYIDYKNANSYDYQVEMAEREETDKNYEAALKYYKSALAIQPEDLKVRLAMADIYMEQKEYDSAMVLYMEIIELDSKNQTAYTNLIRIYESKKDYDSIVSLASDITDAEILKLFDKYIVAPPVISPMEGDYDKFLSVTLLSIEKDDIYYTLDGTEPDEKNGILYDDKKEIKLDKTGVYQIKAACRNDLGIFSEAEEATYVIEVVPPDYPTVSPDGGRITEETLVTIQAKSGCSIYYTWDDTEPTETSAKYEGPIEIPTGNNVLSVLVVDNKTGLMSGVYRTNFIYYP